MPRAPAAGTCWPSSRTWTGGGCCAGATRATSWARRRSPGCGSGRRPPAGRRPAAARGRRSRGERFPPSSSPAAPPALRADKLRGRAFGAPRSPTPARRGGHRGRSRARAGARCAEPPLPESMAGGVMIARITPGVSGPWRAWRRLAAGIEDGPAPGVITRTHRVVVGGDMPSLRPTCCVAWRTGWTRRWPGRDTLDRNAAGAAADGGATAAVDRSSQIPRRGRRSLRSLLRSSARRTAPQGSGGHRSDARPCATSTRPTTSCAEPDPGRQDARPWEGGRASRVMGSGPGGAGPGSGQPFGEECRRPDRVVSCAGTRRASARPGPSPCGPCR